MNDFPTKVSTFAACLIIALYTLYSFGYAQLGVEDNYIVLFVFFSLSITGLIPQHVRIDLSIYLFLVWSVITYVLSINSIDDHMIFILVLSIVFVNHSMFLLFSSGLSLKIVRNLVFVLFFIVSLLSIIQNRFFSIKGVFPVYNSFVVVDHEWNQKYYSFWIVFLCYSVASYLNYHRYSLFLSFLPFSLAAVCLLFGYSDSAVLSFAVGTSVFYCSFHSKMFLYLRSAVRVFLVLYVLFLPSFWGAIPEGFIENIRGLPFNNIGFRVDLYLYSSKIILDRWIWGYGLGSAGQMLASFPIPTGGHPHNIVLSIWMEMGVFGAIFLLWLFLRLASYIDRHASGEFRLSSAWAMFIAGILIFSFSFDFWDPIVSLTYGMWLSMIALVCQQSGNSTSMQSS